MKVMGHALNPYRYIKSQIQKNIRTKIHILKNKVGRSKNVHFFRSKIPVLTPTEKIKIFQFNNLRQHFIFTLDIMEDDFDFDDQEIEQSVAFNSVLDGFQTYERKQFTPDPSKQLYVMGIDVSASASKQFVKGRVQKTEGFVDSEYVIKRPLIQLYCATQNGDSVCINVRDFTPYFIAGLPYGMEDSDANLNKLRLAINQLVKDCPVAITKISSVKKLSIRNYKPDYVKETEKFIKIQTISQAVVPNLRKIFQSETFVNGVVLPRQTYESNIPYLLRFMIDKDIVGMGWFKINPGYKLVQHNKKTTRCQAQIQCQVDLIEALPTDEWGKIAPLRILSFDIECSTTQGFPSADKDQVIQIACICKNTMSNIEDYRVVFVLDGASPISGAHVKHMHSEKQMLQDFEKLLISYDPDFIIGYNMMNFDMKFLLERARNLKMKNYGYFGRNLSRLSSIRTGKFQSKAMGMRQTIQVNTDGRIQLDLLIHMHKQHKLTSYRLNNVSYHFLGDQKQDVHHTQITKLHQESKDSRKRLAIYCLKDAQLPLRLMEKLCCLYNYCQMARVTGVPINFLLNRGQQIKVVSQLLRKSKSHGYIMPTQKVKNSEPQIGYEGAYVLDPKPGFYKQPIATLDFASLYPSIMRAHNLCYTTLIRKSDLQKYELKKQDVYVTPQNIYFVKDHKRKGLLPQILRQLITARKKAKKQLAQTTDPMMQKVLDGRQLALKISANSVYGFTGAVVGQLPCLEISSSVTLIGRTMIDKTRNKVMELYDCDVIYGDTDSVMVKFNLKQKQDKTKQIQQSMEYGKQAAQIITKQFVDPIKLEFEKVYCPYLLITKKRYAGVYYTKPQKYDKVDKKGIETVRRDNCLLIRQILQTVLQTVLIENNIEKTQIYIKSMISELLQNKIDISKLVITKAISKNTEEDNGKKEGENKNKKKTYKSKQAHTELAQKMKKRDENVDIHIGDRIPYVMIQGAKWSKNYDNAEDPIKVLNEDLPIDYDYYIEKQIKPPLERLLKNTGIIHNFDLLFSGEHTRIRYAPKLNQKSGMGSFLTKKLSCINCKRASESVLCDNCAQKDLELYLQKKTEVREVEKECSDLLMQCHNCQRSCMMQVICANVDCPIYYRRIKIKKELEQKEKQMDRFDSYMLKSAGNW